MNFENHRSQNEKTASVYVFVIFEEEAEYLYFEKIENRQQSTIFPNKSFPLCQFIFG